MSKDASSIQFGSREFLSKAIRDIRRMRNLRTADVAGRMGIALRSYELFEAGGGRMDIERLFSFAEATDSDPFALIYCVPLKSSDFAVACADTKLAYIMAMELRAFFEDRGSDIAFLEPPNIIGGFERVFKEFGKKLDEDEAFLRRWFEGHRAPSVSLGKLSLRGLARRKS